MENNYSRVVDALPGQVWTALPDGKIDFVNSRWCEYTGIGADEAIPLTWKSAIHPEDLPQFLERWRSIFASGEPGEMEARLRRFDGEYRRFLISANPMRDEAGKVVKWYGLDTDIEDLWLAEETLRLRDRQPIRLVSELDQRVAERTRELAETNENLQLQAGLLQHLPVSAWTLKPDGTPDFVNQVWLEFSGQTLDFARSHPEAWMTVVHPDDREAAAKAFCDGVRTGQGFAFETRSLRARDGTYRWHLQQAVALHDAEGKVLKLVGTTTDIDDQKRAEEALSKVRSELAHVARVTSLGALAASIAHEVSQPLSGILTNASTGMRMLVADPPDVDGALETTRRTIRDVKRASEVMTRLRTLFSKKEATAEPVDLNEATREVVALTTTELQRNRIILRSELADDLSPVAGDRVQLQQVVLNLLLNASDAMNGVVDRPRQVVIRTERDEGDGVRLTVQDAGKGIDPENPDKLFEAFYTTKSAGMGMGLSVSRSIIESHRGRLWAASNDGPGTTFSFCLPCITGDIADNQNLDLARELGETNSQYAVFSPCT